MKKFIIGALGLAFACSTTVLSTWRKPGVDLGALQNIVVVVKTKDEGMRRSAEDRIVKSLAPRHAVASYTLVPGPTEDNELRQKIDQSGFDGSIVLRVASVEQQSEWVPGTWMGPTYGFAGWADYAPGYVETNTYVRVETNIYAVPSDDLIWSATSRTENPTNMNNLIDETVRALAAEIKKQAQELTPVSLREF